MWPRLMAEPRKEQIILLIIIIIVVLGYYILEQLSSHIPFFPHSDSILIDLGIISLFFRSFLVRQTWSTAAGPGQ